MVELLRQSRKTGATLLWSANLPVRQIINRFEIAVLYTAQPFLICTLNTGQLVLGYCYMKYSYAYKRMCVEMY